MTDDADVCGADTTDGGTCDNPAGENGRCWIPSHNDPDAENPHGRDFAISEADHETILDAARDGFSKAGCARAAGVDEKSLQRYINAHDDFRRAFMRARHKGERTLVKGPLIADEHNVGPDGMEIDGQHARFLLSTSFDYKKTEKKEITGEDGGPITVESDVVTVTESDE